MGISLAHLRYLFRRMGVGPTYFVVRGLALVVIPLLDGLSLLLLAPLIEGFIRQDYSFLQSAPVFGGIIARFPELTAQNANVRLFGLVVGSIVGAALLKNFFAYVFALYSSHRHGLFAARMRQALFERYLSFGKLYFDRTSQGTVTGMLQFADHVVTLLDIAATILTSICSVVVYLAIMTFISWPLTLLTLAVFPAYHYSVAWMITRAKRSGQQQAQLGLDMQRELFNMLSSITLMKAYNREAEAVERLQEMNREARVEAFRVARRYELVQPLQETLTIIALFLLVSAMALMFARGHGQAVSQFLLFLYLARIAIPQLAKATQLRIPLIESAVRLERLMEVFQDDGKHCVSSGSRIFPGLRQQIQFCSLTFGYTSHPVLQGVSLRIECGKRTAIVGPSGAGKTTLISLLMRFYDCPPGTILLDGVDIREFSLQSLTRHLALVSQDIFIFNDTLRHNIQFGQRMAVDDAQLYDVLRRAQLEGFVRNLPKGLDTEVGDRGVQLSGGEKQRVAIARALLKNAEILILDEVTSSLDSATEEEIRQAIEEATRGRTLIVIAHRLSTIRHADKIIVLEDGRVIEEGNLKTLLANRGAFSRYWQAQDLWVDDSRRFVPAPEV